MTATLSNFPGNFLARITHPAISPVAMPTHALLFPLEPDLHKAIPVSQVAPVLPLLQLRPERAVQLHPHA